MEAEVGARGSTFGRHDDGRRTAGDLSRGMVVYRPPSVVMVACIVLLLAGCDAVEPEGAGYLVVEAFVDAGRPLPLLTVRATEPLGAADPAGNPVTDADVVLTLDGRALPYAPVDGRPGRYGPPEDAGRVPERAAFALSVRRGGEWARAEGRVPPRVVLDSVRLRVPPEPVEAVLLDSLRFDTLGTGARQGFIYPVEVDLFWSTPFAEVDADSAYWVRPYLRPRTAFASAIEDFFVREDQVLRERSVPADARGVRRWTGVYAVPVETASASLPPHRLTAALLRSDEAYARFALTRDEPDRREPRTNVEGGLGIVAGVAVDSLQLEVR